MTGTPAWKREKLETLTRKHRDRTCPRCGQRTLEGLDADRAALLVQLDPEPVMDGSGDYTISQQEIAYRYGPRHPPTEKPTWREHACRETETPLEDTLW